MDQIVAAINAEIARLTQAASLLAGKPQLVKHKRTMSAAGRARISAGQKKRWAAARKAA